MTIASIGTLGTALSSANNQTSLVLTTSAAAAVGTIVVVAVAVDNDQTTDGDSVAVSQISDSGGGNLWFRDKEFTNGQGTAQTGASIAIWHTVLTNPIANGGTITASFASASTADASAMSAWNYSKAPGTSITVEGTPGGLANDAANAGSLDVTTANVPCLRFRAIASESSATTALVNTSTWTLISQAISGAGTSATEMGVRGEWLISTATGAVSAPTGGAGAVDHASAYVALKEVQTAPPTNNSTEDGAQVAMLIRNAIKASSISASAGSFLLPYPTEQVIVDAPQGWWGELDRPIYVSSARFTSDLVWPLFFEGTATVTDVGGWWGQLSPAVVTSRVNFASDLAWLPIPVQTYVQPDATNAVTFGISQDNGRTTVQMVGY